VLEAYVYLMNESVLLSFANLFLKYLEDILTPLRLEVVSIGQILIILLTTSDAQQLISSKHEFKYKNNEGRKT